MSFSRNSLVLIIQIIFLFTYMNNLSYAKELKITLQRAEDIALRNAPELQKLLTNGRALKEKAIQEAQLPDPKFMIGTENVPTDSFSFTQDDMTMISLGLQQTFPPGKSLKIKSLQTKHLATAELRKLHLQKLLLLRNLREAWLELYYWTENNNILHKSKGIFHELLKTTEYQYSANKGTQADVLQAQLELTKFENQLIQSKQKLKVAESQLKRLLSEINENYTFDARLPIWTSPPSLNALKERLSNHPLLAVDKATIAAARSEVAWAKEQYKPGFMVDVSYGIRQGSMTDGTHRSDFVSANLTMDLPIFTGGRQNHQLKASCYQFEGAQLEQRIHFLDLEQELAAQYATWEGLSRQKILYQDQLIPVARQHAKSTLLSYQNSISDFASVFRSRNNEITAQLDYLQIQVEEGKARVALLYLEGSCE